jgi:signal transduction histidine kinase
MAAKEQLFAVLAHDLRSQLYGQNFMLEHLYMSANDISKDVVAKNLLKVLESGKIIEKMCSDFLVWFDSQKGDFQANPKLLYVRPFLTSIAILYRQTSLNLGIHLSFAAEESLVWVTDENLLAIVLRNIVDNAIRHTGSGSINIAASSASGKLLIRVTDTGRGMHPDMIRELKKPARAFRPNGSNFGYRFIREFSTLLGAEIEIESYIGKGTTVTITLPAER